jgi:hypothetical protein
MVLHRETVSAGRNDGTQVCSSSTVDHCFQVLHDVMGHRPLYLYTRNITSFPSLQMPPTC